MQDVKLTLIKTLIKKAMEKMKKEFKRSKIKWTEFMIIIILLGLYKKVALPKKGQSKAQRKAQIEAQSNAQIYLATTNPAEREKDNYESKTIAIPKKLLEHLPSDIASYSDILNLYIAVYINTKVECYTDCVSPLYTIVGSKNHTMQEQTAQAVDGMQLDHSEMTLIDACCATGSLFFGLKTYDWKQVVLNDLNPLRTNFLNVLMKKPFELLKMILAQDLSFIDNPDTKNPVLKEYKEVLEIYQGKRANYHHVDCNVEIAYKMFVFQCIDKHYIENEQKIFNRLLRFIPAHLKLINANAVITQEDCKEYLKNNITIKLPKGKSLTLDSNRLLLLDPPYIGTEKQCSVHNCNYKFLHQFTAEHLEKAQFPFLYYCRSSAPKNTHEYTKEKAEHIMKQKLSDYFFNKNHSFQKVHLDNGATTELMISNRNYSSEQFRWTKMDDDIL
ncbi:MAG: hypothetical protein NC123_17395 [Butyrivibrio sp.]|nr:hypothetical protein [Butyrivibrio sp.]